MPTFRSEIRSWRSLRPSELTGQVRWVSRFAAYPIRLRIGIEVAMYRPAAEEAHGQSDRRDQREEDDAQDDPGIHPTERSADRHPDPVDRFQDPRLDERGQDEGDAQRDRPDPRRSASRHRGPQADERPDAADQQPEVPELPEVGRRGETCFNRAQILFSNRYRARAAAERPSRGRSFRGRADRSRFA